MNSYGGWGRQTKSATLIRRSLKAFREIPAPVISCIYHALEPLNLGANNRISETQTFVINTETTFFLPQLIP